MQIMHSVCLGGGILQFTIYKTAVKKFLHIDKDFLTENAHI